MILLLDVDGVLIENIAYRAATRQTTAYFAERMGLGPVTPTDADIDAYEAQSITVEWDTSAVMAAALLLQRVQAWGKRTPPDTGALWPALDALASTAASARRRAPRSGESAPPDFAALAGQIGALAAAQPEGRRELPARIALGMFGAALGALEGRAAGAWARPLFEQLLGSVYDIDRSPAMQVFQNIIVGDAQYAHHYGLTPLLACEPLLEKLDRVLLRPEMAQRLLAARDAGRARPVIYTARPTLAPVEAGGDLRGYTPEGEIGRDMAGLAGVPMMGFGKLDWLAARLGWAASEMVKPSPVQAMAAMAAACTGLEAEAVKAAAAVARGDHLRYPLTACQGMQVHVFEDSASSLGGVARAVALLNRQGLGLRLTRHGIAARGSAKRANLAKVADVTHDDINEGLAQILGT